MRTSKGACGICRILLLLSLGILLSTVASAQDSPKPLPDAPSSAQQQQQGSTMPHPLRLVAGRSFFFPDLASTPGPLSPSQKFKLFASESISGGALLGSAFGAGIGQAQDSLPGYGQGAEGYAKRFGSSMARGATSNFFGTFLLPSMLHQDPRFFPDPNPSFAKALKDAARRVVITPTDSGGEAFNWSGLLGPLASEGIANTYLPETDRSAGDVFRRYGFDLAFQLGSNMAREYWPVIFKKLRPKQNLQPASPRPTSAATPSAAHPDFGGTYAQLSAGQRRLVDDWFARYNQRTGKNLAPESGYNAVPVSVRTTFEAVTHALSTTPLTGQDGNSSGNTLDLIDLVETAHGKLPRARGDLQFRVYATLKPNATEILKASREFSRKADNSVFHHGYPQNYRQGGGYPSIQISISPDGHRADIDVDYRSSGFPAGLFNGHLTSANSDIRAGNNYSRHLGRWEGLPNWWRNLFGLPVEHDAGFAPDPEHDIASRPRLDAKAKLEDAVNDYLSTWLIEGKPNLAVAYFSPEAFACAGGSSANSAGPVPQELWASMEETNFVLGKPATLKDAIRPATLAGLETISQFHSESFTLVQVPDDRVEEFACGDGISSSGIQGSKFFGAAFRILTRGGDDAPVFLLWRKEQGYWRIVALQTDPSEVKDGPVPDDSEPVAAEPAPPAVHPQQVMLERIDRFFETLLVKKDAAGALDYFDPEAYDCINQSLEPDEKTAAGKAGEKDYLLHDLEEIAKRSRSSRELEQVIESDDPGDPMLTRVSHPHENSYMVEAVPNSESSGLLCAADSPTAASDAYYGTFFKIIEPGDEPAALGLLWEQKNGQWQIVGYRMDEP